jgi:hypothetical protein
MEREISSRRGFLKGLAACLVGVGVLATAAQPAQARPHGYGGWRHRGHGYGYHWGPYRRIYPGGFYGGGWGPPYYSRGYFGAPYIAPTPVVPVQPYYYNNYYYSPPLMKHDASKAIDALTLLEA